MQASDIPPKFPIPWGNAAGGSFIRSIPTASQIGINDGEPSLTDGWVPLNGLPVAGGGKPPDIRDQNGILKQITQWSRWAAAGGRVAWDSAFSAAIGGYPQGAVVASATALGLMWLSAVDNNTTNPDTGGAGWISASSGRLLAIRSLSAGAYAPTSGTFSVEVEVIGGSGGGGGTPATGAGQSAAGGGGGSGARCRGFFTSGFSGAIVTIGAGGAAVSGAAGGNAGTSSFGALLSAPGGIGGGLTLNATPPWASLGGGGGAIAAGGYWNEAGAPGANGISIAAIGVVSGGGGGYGGGAPQFFNNPGVAGIGHGGGSGAAAGASQTAFAGGAGSAGQVIVREYS